MIRRNNYETIITRISVYKKGVVAKKRYTKTQPALCSFSIFLSLKGLVLVRGSLPVTMLSGKSCSLNDDRAPKWLFQLDKIVAFSHLSLSDGRMTRADR